MRRPLPWIVALAVSLPLSMAVTILIHPFWRWFEKATAIESFGHSGPAGWCYLLDWAVISALAVFAVARRGSGGGDGPVNARRP